MVNECVLLVMQRKRDTSKQSKLVASVCDEGETVVNARRRRDRPTCIMEADVLEGRYSCHELVNGNPALSTLHPLHHLSTGSAVEGCVRIGAVARCG
jgi:hypothetical protein